MNIESGIGIVLFVMFFIIITMVMYLLYGYVTELDDKIDVNTKKFVSKSTHETDIDFSKSEDKVLHKRIDNTFDGQYESLTGKPQPFDKSYNSLKDKPVLFDGQYESLEDKPELFDKSYNSLKDKPVLFDGQYESLIGDKSNHMHTTDQITGLDNYFDNKYPEISTFRKDIDSKADVSHKHDYLGINGLSEQLDNKASFKHKHTTEDLELSKNPAYKLDINGNARIGGTTLTEGNMVINNNAPTLFLQDKNNKAGALHVNSDKMYLLSSSGTNKRDWKTNDGAWPAVFNLKNNNASLGGGLYVKKSAKLGGNLVVGGDYAKFEGNVTTKGSINGLTPQQMAYLAKNTPTS